jgi:hypothetical protein
VFGRAGVELRDRVDHAFSRASQLTATQIYYLRMEFFNRRHLFSRFRYFVPNLSEDNAGLHENLVAKAETSAQFIIEATSLARRYIENASNPVATGLLP